MESAAMSVVSTFGQVLVEELQEIRGVGDKVVHLRDELATMNALLRVISEAKEGSVDHLVREWEKQVHDLAYDAEDCVDNYSLRIVRPTHIPRPPPPADDDIVGYRSTSLVGRLARRGSRGASLTSYWARYLVARAKRMARYPYQKLVLQRALAADIKDLLARTTIVSERRARYGIAALPTSECFVPVSASSISANSLRRVDNPNQLVGITEQAKGLANKIRGVKGTVHDEDDKIKEVIHDEDDRSLKVLSIVGFGGLGKTTLAMELCRQLDTDYPCQALVSVSQAFNVDKDMKELLERVLQQILKDKPNDAKTNPTTVDELSKRIKEILNQTRCLIVIDDVWSLSAWEAIRVRLLENNCCSRIIVTTRIEAVAKAASVNFVHHMKPLKQEASKELFVKRVFGYMAACPGGLEEYMDTILKKCGGMPLAIISIASLLPSYSSAEGTMMWEKVSRSIGSQMESHPTLEGMRQLITLSYDYLPHHLKACMMYLSIFPEDYVIDKNGLLYRWIAEGLITEKRGLTLFEVAEEYFDELVSRNMIQVDKSYGAEKCRIHDMILEVMVSKSQESNFVSLVGRQYGGMPHGHGKIRRLSIHDNDQDEQRPKKVEKHHARHGFEAMKLRHVRSLTTFHRNYGVGKLLDRLGELKLLRVLDLEGCKSVRNKHMRDVCQLYLLRFLSLRGTNVSKMPRKVGNLEHLETLDVQFTFIMNLPQTVTKLSKLERLKCDDWILPRGLGNMKALRELDFGVLNGDNVPWVTQEIGELPRLQALTIVIKSDYQTDEFIQESLPKLATSLSKTSNLQSLKLFYWEGGSLEFLIDVSTPPPLLQCLCLHGRISQLPDWISSLTHLTKFKIGETELAGDQLFGVLCKLPNLQSVVLYKINCKAQELVVPPEHSSFPMLRTLEVAECPIVLTFKEGSMTKLETLLLWYGAYRAMEKMSIVGFENLENLKEVRLIGYKGNPSMVSAVEQLKTVSESKQIKVVAHWRE